MSEKKVLLRIEDLCKRFGETVANSHINMEIMYGEIVGIVGENGSGKSTLLSQIAGIIKNDSGEMFLKGEKYSPKNALEANQRKISMVVQEIGTVTSLSAGANIFLGKTGKFSKFGIVSNKKISNEIDKITKEWGLPSINSNMEMNRLDIETKKMIELVRALASDPDLLILDEVTQSLSHNNREVLFNLIKNFKNKGRTVVMISHDIEELIEITDRIVVLRDGVLVQDIMSKEATSDQVKKSMVGRDISFDYYRADMVPSHNEEVVLEVRDLSVKGKFEPLSFDVYSGEIVGFCGLSDSGIHDVGKAVYGVIKQDRSGTIKLKNNTVIKNAEHALRIGLGYLPKDRDHDCLMLKASIRDNFALTNLNEARQQFGYISPKKLNNMSIELTEKYRVKCRDIYQEIGSLSGGNKQKVNIGRWMSKDLSVLILDCPTRGVDIGVKAYIYQLIKESKENGLAIILISDELTEILGMSDRIIVMKNGTDVARLNRGVDFTEEKVIGVMA